MKTKTRNLREQVYRSKPDLRQAVWDFMEENDLVAFPRPCYGRIPNFPGSGTAAEKLKTLPEWKEARFVFSAPDSSLHPARVAVLAAGKALLVAAPRLAGFYLLRDVPTERAFEASSIRGFSRFGRRVENLSLPSGIDLYLTGAVAVDMLGNRIGKGSGYGDREDALLCEAGLMNEKTPRAVLVHEAQVFEDLSSLMEEKDRQITVIVTPERIYRIPVGRLRT